MKFELPGLKDAGKEAARLSLEQRGNWDVWYKRSDGYRIVEDWGYTPSDLLREGWTRVMTFSGGRPSVDLTGTYREKKYVRMVQKEDRG